MFNLINDVSDETLRGFWCLSLIYVFLYFFIDWGRKNKQK